MGRRRRGRPWRREMVDPDRGGPVESLPTWSEVYDRGGRLLGLILDGQADGLLGWASRRPAGSEYKVVIRGGTRVVMRIMVLVHAGRTVEITSAGDGR